MENISIIVYTMKGCPFCTEFKNMLTENGIDFYDRDIHEYQEEYQLFTEITKSELIPSLMIIEGTENDYESNLYVPEKDYQELTEALDIVKKKLNIV